MATRIVLHRPAARFEAEFLSAVRRSRSLHRHFAQPPRTRVAFRESLRRSRRQSHEGHFLIERNTRALIGVVNVMEIVRGSFQSAYLGYYGFLPHTGRGLLLEGVSEVIARAFGELSLHRLEANIQPDNVRSIALVKRLGFRREGFSPRYLKLAGRWCDHERWAIAREEWRPRRVAAPQGVTAGGATASRSGRGTLERRRNTQPRRGPAAGSAAERPVRWAAARDAMSISLKRAYEAPSRSDGFRILVERLWPRGLSKEDAQIDLWPKEVAPSAELRRWFNHDPGKWTEFKRRYFKELRSRNEALQPILERVRAGRVTFVFASRESRFNNAVALKEYVEHRR